MNPLPARMLHAVAAVVDVAQHARPDPVTAKALAARHRLPPRHLEGMLQILVRSGILRGMRGPKGGYELGRERRRVSVGDVVRAIQVAEEGSTKAVSGQTAGGGSDLVSNIVLPAVAEAAETFLARLDEITIEDLCRRAGPAGPASHRQDFTI